MCYAGAIRSETYSNIKLTLTNDDGTTVDFFDQAYTDQAVAAAQQANTSGNTTPMPVVEPTDTEVDIVLSDGTTRKFVPAQ